MQLTEIKIQHYRSIEDITLIFPENKPGILFGSKNMCSYDDQPCIYAKIQILIYATRSRFLVQLG